MFEVYVGLILLVMSALVLWAKKAPSLKAFLENMIFRGEDLFEGKNAKFVKLAGWPALIAAIILLAPAPVTNTVVLLAVVSFFGWVLIPDSKTAIDHEPGEPVAMDTASANDEADEDGKVVLLGKGEREKKAS